MFLTYVDFQKVREVCSGILSVPSNELTDERLEEELKKYEDVYKFYMRMKEANER